MPIKFLKMLKKRRAFTLTETIVMITIILILTGIIIVATESSRALARDKKRIAHFAAYQQALSRYYSQSENYNPDRKKSFPGPRGQAECTSSGCNYDSDHKICTCQIRKDNEGGVLKVLEEKNLLDQMLFDPKDDSTHWYSYNIDEAGQNYKLVVLLERDIASMKNDGGDCPVGDNTDKCPLKDPNDPSKGRYTALYEVYSTLGAHLAFGYWGITGKSALACDIVADTSCITTPDKPLPVLRLSAQNNAHAQLASYSGQVIYSNTLCCSGPPDLSVQEANCISGICSNILTLSANTNAHVGNNYTNSYVSFKRTGGSVSCSIKSSCDTNESCLVSISSSTNAHIGKCDVYSNKVCCKAPSNF